MCSLKKNTRSLIIIIKCAISNGEHVACGGAFSLSSAQWVRPGDGYYRYNICNECGPDNLAPYNIIAQQQQQQQQRQQQAAAQLVLIR